MLNDKLIRYILFINYLYNLKYPFVISILEKLIINLKDGIRLVEISTIMVFDIIRTISIITLWKDNNKNYNIIRFN